MKFQQLTNSQQIDDVLKYSKVLLFKHSTTCPISANAYSELEEFSRSEEANDVNIAVVYVIEDRPVSNEIAERFQIKHESPQALFIQSGKVVWHASHWNITEDALKKACKSAD
ncbi:bacillithiol system redox-active protein YtxJ [Paenactinomyces guangxiensis]|uniref:Bacillithiol system redox-active protein YtxJ n=1 Tax=Paenactinomyces guangxiensis TaxID=1490290 RepID=A0A7W1WMZ8_9BACL|nr:bacillithiol system redox-active protein YtxJ [Paenactinomyces guangxiensis]MBA4492825.1 bacillithiol system redox-active protein YtxJ [Paenactinomyces guangxiensis]MBH8590326.1 bacillithiol system redox-active protein YtxJ [Paenactinomyces guangxiensis]